MNDLLVTPICYCGYVFIRDIELNVIILEVILSSGNEGSVAGDDAAAPRYLDAKLSKYAYKCFFEEFDESVIEMQPNYLRSDVEPVVFPARYPNFLLNLTTGIAWGSRKALLSV